MPRNGDLRALRSMNRQRVVDALVDRGPTTQAELARMTGLSPATVSSIVRGLTEDRAVVLSDTGHVGRRGHTVRFAPDLGVVAGIDVGHRHLRVAIGALDYTIIADGFAALAPDHKLDDDLDLADKMLDKLLAEHNLSGSDVVHTAVGLPAPLDLVGRRIVTAAHLPRWSDTVDQRVTDDQRITDRLNDASVDNDANLGALGELVWGSAHGASNAVYIKFSTSIGAGLIIDGRLARGERGSAGEIGHMIVEPGGQACFCGARGCLLTVVGAAALLEQVRHVHGPDLTIERLLDLAEHGDRSCARVIEDAGRHIGIVIASLCNVLNPSRVVIGGTLASAGNLMLDAARAAARRNALPFTVEHVDIVRGQLGEKAEVHGAIALAIRSAAAQHVLANGPNATPAFDEGTDGYVRQR